MKPIIRNMMFTGLLAMAASSIAVAQTSTRQFEQWYGSKYGRPAPTEVARVAAEQENTAYREEAPRQVTTPINPWFEGWYRAKYGRPSHPEEARIQAELANTAYREEKAVQAGAPGNNWYEGWYRAKFGRSSHLAEMRSKD
jgi:hypothetical protein